MRAFVVTNSGKRVSDLDAARIVQASARELPRFCAFHGLAVPSLRYCPDPMDVQPGEEQIDLADQPPPGETGVLGEHSEENDLARGVVYAGFELDNGGKALSLDGSEPAGAVTVASIFFHELTEQLRRPVTNDWWDGPITVKGTQYASVVAEVADPVEDGFVKQTADDGTEVWLSNYITSAWSDPQATTGPFDANGVLSAPFTTSTGGYVVVRNAPGSEQSVFPDGYPAHRKALKERAWKVRLGR